MTVLCLDPQATEETLGLTWAFEIPKSIPSGTLSPTSPYLLQQGHSQVVPLPDNKTLKCMRLWRPFLFKPPHTLLDQLLISTYQPHKCVCVKQFCFCQSHFIFRSSLGAWWDLTHVSDVSVQLEQLGGWHFFSPGALSSGLHTGVDTYLWKVVHKVSTMSSLLMFPWPKQVIFVRLRFNVVRYYVCVWGLDDSIISRLLV